MEDIKEEWKPYHFKGLNYMVSNFGNIIGCARGNLLKTRPNEDGYMYVTLGNTKNRSSKPVHRIVAKLFVPNDNPQEKVEVNHLDTNRMNPRFDNLEWCTHRDNVDYSVKLGNYYKEYWFGEGNPNYGNDTLKKKYAENPELAKINNSRPAEQNGRSVEITMIDIVDGSEIDFKYIGKCCEWLIEHEMTNSNVNSIRTTITKYIKEDKAYKNRYKFKHKI